MALSIRLSRGGAKKRPFYRIVVADSRKARDGRFIEILGTYNPMVTKDNPERIRLKQERIQYWLGVGAKPSERVHRFLADADMMPARVIPTQTKKDKPKARAQERLKEAEDAAKAAAEAPAEEVAAGEAPAEEVAAEAPAEEAAAEEVPAEEVAAEAPAEEEEKKSE